MCRASPAGAPASAVFPRRRARARRDLPETRPGGAQTRHPGSGHAFRLRKGETFTKHLGDLRRNDAMEALLGRGVNAGPRLRRTFALDGSLYGAGGGAYGSWERSQAQNPSPGGPSQ
ncbi:hypothetical protein GCM10010116_02240 [Microbispora rosea subsp. aerata]|nr:hypothetical protein GCM10010116_02240 [Microbispora rosea subsp. aerata]GIH56374.1 hypothetical protein Mro02_32880 [Microbispora rosea subsp. aerata]GLJ81604.1 hypothetical protein GCM10017588_03290 [Microbispora rosea subsp. aerata]